jgi:hypothetical protein
MSERKAVTKATAERYGRSSKKEKGQILDEFVKLTLYDRSYARWLLRGGAKKKTGEDKRRDKGKREAKRTRSRVYDDRVLLALERVWKIMDFICGKRLWAVLDETLDRLENFGEIRCDRETRGKLRSISASTIDRLLAGERRKHQLKGRGGTRPGSLLKKQIPMRTFSEWDEGQPGFVEIDLVAHDGGLAFGDYLQTLDMTDVYSGWTEVAPVRNKAQIWVFEALKTMRSRLPFPLLGIDSDNGSEFINNQLHQYCKDEQITFTRSRPHRKNDNCFVEQKNYTVVRRHVGYQRLDTLDQQQILLDLYRCLRRYVNFFQPSMRLVSKERCGATVRKKYSRAETPFQRLLASPHLAVKQKQKLRKEYKELNPAELKRKIEALQKKLLKTAAATRSKAVRSPAPHPWRVSAINLEKQRRFRVDY